MTFRGAPHRGNYLCVFLPLIPQDVQPSMCLYLYCFPLAVNPGTPCEPERGMRFAPYFVGLCLFLVMPLGRADPVPVVPIKAKDGGTFDASLADANKITARLAGCDAPERTQPYSKRATDTLRAILSSDPVTADCYKQDRYRRGVCRVAVPAGDVCLALIREGLAWHCTAYAREQTPKEREDFRQAQEAAQTARRGLWKDDQPVPHLGSSGGLVKPLRL